MWDVLGANLHGRWKHLGGVMIVAERDSDLFQIVEGQLSSIDGRIGARGLALFCKCDAYDYLWHTRFDISKLHHGNAHKRSLHHFVIHRIRSLDFLLKFGEAESFDLQRWNKGELDFSLGRNN